MPCAASVSSLAKRTRGSISAAARANCGAIILHGPHQSAQKSTTTGMSLRATWRSKLASLSAAGWPSKSGLPHWPQMGASARRSRGTRLVVSQWGHTRCSGSAIARSMTSGAIAASWMRGAAFTRAAPPNARLLESQGLNGEERAMQVRAAVAHKPGAPLSIETVTLDGPRAGEVLVEIKATGICHTDDFTRSGADPEGLFPAILGHEGAGVVVDVG